MKKIFLEDEPDLEIFLRQNSNSRRITLRISALDGKITITGNDTTEIISDTTITGKLHVTDKQTNDSTITATDSITGKGVVLDTHTHTISSGSSAGTTRKPN